MHLTNGTIDPKRSLAWRHAVSALIVTLLSLGSSSAIAESTSIGRVLTGDITATGKDRPIQTRKVVGGEAFVSGETLTTQDKHAVIGFNDGTKMTLRAHTELVITSYRYGYGQGEALFSLNKGGIRVSTGKIAENNPSKFRVSTPYGDLALPDPYAKGLACAEGCDYDAGRPKGPDTSAGHVAFCKGKVTITRKDHPPTAIKAGDQLERGNTIAVGRNGLAVLALTDGQRRTLKPNESYTIR